MRKTRASAEALQWSEITASTLHRSSPRVYVLHQVLLKPDDGDPDTDREGGQSAEDALDSNGSEVDAMKETRYQARDGDFEDAIDPTSSDGDVSASSEAADLILGILQQDPRQRIPIKYMWKHPLLKKYENLDSTDNNGRSYTGSAPPLTIQDCGTPIKRPLGKPGQPVAWCQCRGAGGKTLE